jgi:hypothetical protein
MRDEFTKSVKKILAERVGVRCSNPDCRRSTSGPGSDPTESVNIGVAAHITAAAPGGPRYNPDLSSEERKSPENGIWLCQNCAKLIDNDPEKFTEELLLGWKSSAETLALQRIQGIPPAGNESASLLILSGHLDRLARRVSSGIEKRLEDKREAWREGHRDEALRWLEEIKNDNDQWPILSSETRAMLLRFEASLRLDTERDVCLASELADEARSLAPKYNDARLRALIAYYEIGPEAAINILMDHNDIDSLNLRAAFLFEMGQISEGQELLKFEKMGIRPNVETFRLRALSSLQAKDLNRAQFEIQKALGIKPRWDSVRYTAATINYFSALSPAALPNRIVPWPEPVHWAEVKTDDQSISRLREAQKVFRDLSEMPGISNEEKQRFQGWLLASLTVDQDRKEEAQICCELILQSAPDYVPAISWAIAHNLEVDLEPSKTILEKEYEEGSSTIPDILTLVGCYMQSGEIEKSLQLLEETETVFRDSEAESAWAFWYVESQILSDRPEIALEVIDRIEMDTGLQLQRARSLVLGAMATKSGEWGLLIQHLESSYEKTKDSRLLLELCGLKAQRQDWDYVANRAQLLIDEFATGEVVKLAVISAYSAQRFDLCLELLDDSRELFRHQRLPGELRRIRALCQYALGVLPEAISELEALTRDRPTKSDLLTLSQLYLDKGDFKRLTIVSRQLNTHYDLTAEESLRLSRLVQWEDRRLAISLWRKAVSQELLDSLVSEALVLGYQLGLDQELRDLHARMETLGRQGKGGIQVADIRDLITFSEQRKEYEKELNDAYIGGKAPTHLIAAEFNYPLVELYHGLPKKREEAPDPLRQPLLLTRHGGRALIHGFPESVPQWRLNLDITALLLATHLEIIGEVEQAFAPLRIPATVMPALVQMKEKMAHHQPMRLEHCRQIVELIDEDALGVVECTFSEDYANAELSDELGSRFAALLEAARDSKGYLVCFFPLRKLDLSGPPSALPEDADRYLVNCRSVLEGLRESGPLSHSKYADGLEKLGREGQIFVNLVPEKGSSLYCLGGISGVLADAGLLRAACESFQVHIEQKELDQIRAELKEYERRQDVGKWLDTLMERISQGISEGEYELISIPSLVIGEIEEISVKQPALACLDYLLRFEAEERDFIWSDDRFVNGFFRCKKPPIIGINEILKALVSVSVLQASDYYDKISRLRAANVRFVPVEAEEILYQLQQANIEDQVLVETQELRNLRLYVGACLTQNQIFQKPSVSEETPNAIGEVAFALNLISAVNRALARLWMTEMEDEHKQWARAEWLMRNLYLDHLGLDSVIPLQQTEKDEHYLVALSLASLLSQVIDFISDSDDSRSLQSQKYLHWLYNRILRSKFEANPHLVASVADILKTTTRHLQDSLIEEKEATPEQLISLLQLFYERLPEPIQEELWLDEEFMASIGIQTVYAVTFGDLSFNPDEFFEAIGEAVNGGRATVRAISTNENVACEICPDPSPPNSLCFDHLETGKREIIVNQDFELLLDSPTEREVLLRRNRHWFDCSEDVFNQAVAEIVSTENPRQRVEKMREWREQSAAVYYEELLGDLEEKKAIDFNELKPPSIEGLLRHLRLEPDVEAENGFSKALDTAARSLIREENLTLTMNRLTGLPIPLPNALIEAFESLSVEDRYDQIKKLVRTIGSPISQVHLLHLLLHFGDERVEFRRLARRIVKGLLSDEGVKELNAFLAILQWVNDEFYQISDTRDLPVHIKLALVWTHTHCLFSTFAYFGIPADWLQEKFAQANLGLSREIFDRDSKYWFDVSHPRRAYLSPILICALDYALGTSKTEIVDEVVCARLESLAFYDTGKGIRIPAPGLLRNWTKASNSLSSFLGGDLGRKALGLLTDENAKVMQQESLQALAEEVLEKISEDEDYVLGWIWLYAVFGDLPSPDSLSARLVSLIRQTDFVELFRKSIEAGGLGILMASLQVVHFNDQKLRLYLRDQLIIPDVRFKPSPLGE